jgi:hypothetical protein
MLARFFFRAEIVYQAVADEIGAHCTKVIRTMNLANPLNGYTSVFTAYVSSMRVLHNLFAFLNRNYLPHAREVGRADHSLCIYDLAMLIWRDVVLRRCVDRLVRDATADGIVEYVVAVLESSKKMFFDRGGNHTDPVIATFAELQQRLQAEPIVFEPRVRSGWTKQSHHSCCASTRDAVRTLLLVRQRLKVNPEAVASAYLPRDSLLDTWSQVAKFLPRR